MILRSNLSKFLQQVYLHSDADFNTISTHLDHLITAIGGASRRLSSHSPQDDASRRLEAAGRQLQTLDDGVSATRYECDDTLFECEPVCVETVTEGRLRDPNSEMKETNPCIQY